jgi:hypothetical protein
MSAMGFIIEGVIATGKFSNILKFIVEEVCVFACCSPLSCIFVCEFHVRISAHEQMEGILDTLSTPEISASCLACYVYIKKLCSSCFCSFAVKVEPSALITILNF